MNGLNEANDNRLDQLYRETRADLLRYFRRRHGSDEVAEDLLQETFAGVLKHPERLLTAQSARAYLFGAARRVSADYFRRRRLAEPLDDDLPMETELEDPRLQTMRQAMDELASAPRQVLELRLRREMSYEEIAGALGIPIGTVRSRLHHAIKYLAQAMKKQKL